MMVGTDGEEKKVTPLVHSLLSHCSVLGRRLRPGPTASTRLLKNRPWTAAWDRSDGPRLRTRDHHQRQKDQSKDAGGLLLPRLATRVFCLFCSAVFSAAGSPKLSTVQFPIKVDYYFCLGKSTRRCVRTATATALAADFSHALSFLLLTVVCVCAVCVLRLTAITSATTRA